MARTLIFDLKFWYKSNGRGVRARELELLDGAWGGNPSFEVLKREGLHLVVTEVLVVYKPVVLLNHLSEVIAKHHCSVNKNVVVFVCFFFTFIVPLRARYCVPS